MTQEIVLRQFMTSTSRFPHVPLAVVRLKFIYSCLFSTMPEKMLRYHKYSLFLEVCTAMNLSAEMKKKKLLISIVFNPVRAFKILK